MALAPLAEQFFHLENMASSVQVSDRNSCPTCTSRCSKPAEILDLDRPNSTCGKIPVPNAYTFAMRGEQPFVVIHTSLLELLTPAETQAVIAHELGHLKCEHSVYLTLANLIDPGRQPTAHGGGAGPEPAVSTDGVGALCRVYLRSRGPTGSPRSSHRGISLLMKLSGGSPIPGVPAECRCLSRPGPHLRCHQR
jgi:hypothetical protein